MTAIHAHNAMMTTAKTTLANHKSLSGGTAEAVRHPAIPVSMGAEHRRRDQGSSIFL